MFEMVIVSVALAMAGVCIGGFMWLIHYVVTHG